jgi:hypothetical protein
MDAMLRYYIFQVDTHPYNISISMSMLVRRGHLELLDAALHCSEIGYCDQLAINSALTCVTTAVCLLLYFVMIYMIYIYID